MVKSHSAFGHLVTYLTCLRHISTLRFEPPNSMVTNGLPPWIDQTITNTTEALPPTKGQCKARSTKAPNKTISQNHWIVNERTTLAHSFDITHLNTQRLSELHALELILNHDMKLPLRQGRQCHRLFHPQSYLLTNNHQHRMNGHFATPFSI